jgi:uncharacterized membrane protein
MEEKYDQKPHPKKFYAWLLDELKLWQEEKLIDEKQADCLRQRYTLAETPGTHNKLVRILTILGVLLIGAGIIIFFAANWEKMANGSKLAVIFVSLLTSYLLGYYWKYEPGNYPILGAAFILLGAIIFGAGILLISQIYNLGGKLPDAILIWSISSLLMAWLSGLVPVMALASVLFTTWSVLFSNEFNKPVYYYLIFMALNFMLAYRYHSALLVVLNIVGIGIWLATLLKGTSYYYGGGDYLVVIYAILGILVYASGYFNHFSPKTIGFTFWYRLVGALTILIAFYILSFKGFIADMIYESSQHSVMSMPHILWTIVVLSLLAFIVAFVNMFFRQGRTKTFRYEMLVPLFLVFFLFFAISYPGDASAQPYRHFSSPSVVYFSVFLNLIFFALIIGTILLGYFNGESTFIYIGLIVFVINLITRYCEYAWAMMDRSLFFIGGGIILLVGGFYLERLRRKLLQGVKTNE